MGMLRTQTEGMRERERERERDERKERSHNTGRRSGVRYKLTE